MRTVQVHFPSGKEVLGRYWGMLRGGGLHLDLPMPPELDVAPEATADAPLSVVLPGDAQRGERLRLQVHVRTIKKTFQVLAQLLDLTQRPRGLRAVVGFLPESPPDDLLDAVWADGLNVPQRRTRRLPVRAPVHFAAVTSGDASLRRGELRNLSLGGCCIAGSALPPRGSQVMVRVGCDALTAAGAATLQPGLTLQLAGRVRWTERPAAGLMGIEFLGPSDERLALAQVLEGLGARP